MFSEWVSHRFAAVLVKAQIGGGERNRTDDLLLAKQALSQLSYTPKSVYLNLARSTPKGSTYKGWWAWVDLNYRPHAYQACALTKLSYRPIFG